MQQTHSCIRHIVRIGLVILALESVASAQITNVTDDQSTPTPGAGHNYIGMMNETVNPANGSVSFRLGTPVPPGRGLTLPFTFAYDSNGASHVIPGPNGSAAWTSNNGFGEGGWSVTLPMLSWTYATYTQEVSGQIYYSCDYVANFVFQDPTGGRHFLGMLGIVDSQQQCVYTSMGQTSYLIGGDDLHYSVATSFLGSGVGTVMVTDSITGTAYSFNVLDTAQSTTAAFVEDRNGNRVTLGYPGSNPMTVTDTLGRAAVSMSTASGVWTVNVSGLSNPYTAYWGGPWGSSPAVGQNYAWTDSYCNGTIPGYTQLTQVVTSITLPNGQEYQFSYDSTYGLLSQITYPTGAWVKYTWGWSSRADQVAISDSLGNPAACGVNYDVPAVTERQVSFDGSTTALTQYFTYSTNWTGSPWKTTVVTTTDNVTGATTVTNYQYTGVPVPVGMVPGAGTYIPYVPVESTVTYQDGNNKTYRVENEVWADQYEMTCKSTTDYFNGAAGPITRTQYSAGPIYPWSNVSVWDWGKALPCGQTAGAPPTRQTIYDTQAFNVQVYPASTWPNGNDPTFWLPTSVTTNYNGAEAAQTTFGYDSGGASVQGEQVTGRDSNYNLGGSASAPRGNALSKTELNTGGSSPQTTYTFDDNGQMVSMTDACGNIGCSDMIGTNHTTSYSYSDHNAYLSEINYPTTANGAVHTVSFTYNFADGQLASETDQNHQPTSYYYGQNGELLDRLTSISYPDGGSTTYSYNSICGDPASTSILLSAGSNYTSTASMDALCHVTGTAITSDPQGTDYTTTVYDGHGRTWKAYNPYRGQSDTSYGFTLTNYDPLGRVSSVVSPDGSTTTTSYSTSNNQECAQVTDPAGVSRKPCSDALGRLAQVTENGIGATTYYVYDGLDDLLSVSQGGQSPGCTSQGNQVSRSFTYDSLRRLVNACNPESGTTSYSYDANGNTATRQDARSITTNYAYDVLNRVAYKTYLDGTPAASFFYDVPPGSLPAWSGVGFSYATGRMTVACTGSTAGTCSGPQTAVAYSYDKMGRPAYYWQCTPLNCGNSSIWQTSYTYDAAGDVINWTHPAGFTISQPVDGARHIMQVTSSVNTSPYPGTLAQGTCLPNSTSVCYTAWGAVSLLQNGCVNLGSGCTNTQESYFYNNRLQMAVAELGTPGANGAKSCREYSYQANVTPSGCAESSTSWPTGSANNGNVAGYYYADSANGGLSHKASYVYDGGNGANGVNRLTSALATPVLSGTVGYSQSFSYDIYGNMSCSASPAEPQCLAATYNDTNYPNPNSNRLQYITSGGVNVSYGYDLAGNLTNDGTNTYYWDAEARLTAVTNGQGTISANTYNALGQRVEDATLTSTTEEAYGAGGSLLLRSTGDSNSRTFVPFGGGILAEYYCGGMIFDHPDQLGSATSATDCTGNIVNAKLFLPFGEFWTGAANPNLGMHQMFAQLPDYDPETDEYNTANRHYSPSGRWLSPDPGGLKYVHLDDPQTWNMYAYVRDNPTTVTDPTGLGDPPPNGAPASARGDGCDKPSNDCNQAAANVLAGMAIGLYNSGADMLNLVLQVDYHAPAEALLPEIPLEGSEQKIGALASAGVFFMIPGGGEEETGVELASRASEIHSALDDVIAQGMRTTAVADVTNADGTASRVVASSEKNLAPVQKAALREGETAVSGKGHAEQKIAGWAERNGAKINAIAASRPICTSCQTLIRTMIDLMIH